MGHIANKIDAKDKKLSEILFNNRYRIDPFQREYRWQRKHIEALISDLSISFLKNYKEGHLLDNCNDYDCYYMGPIVLCDSNNELSIIDGQQRLTSFTLLLIYLYHAQEHLNLHEDIKQDLKQYLYVKKAGKKTLVLNIDSRTEIFEMLISNPKLYSENIECIDFEKFDSNHESIQNILARYEDITNLFPDDINSHNVLPLFIEWLLNNIVLVEVKAYSMENAYSIFETMNDRGLTLNPTEILKGYLLNKINDEDRNEEINIFWKGQIQKIKNASGSDNSDMDFFRAWLRAKYAVSIRQTKQGAENEDFEIIGTNFHTWVKNNPDKTFLKSPEDYYFFIKSDFAFYSEIYIKITNLKSGYFSDFERVYVSNFYPIADSLSNALYLAPVSKIDDELVIIKKVLMVNKYIDIMVFSRLVQSKSVTQTSIRNIIYELVKTVRNVELETLRNELELSITKIYSNLPSFKAMDNWGYFHYFYARILNHLGNDEVFAELLRSRKQKSYVLVRIFSINDKSEDYDEYEEFAWSMFVESIAGYCLIRRYDMHALYARETAFERITFLKDNSYLPEMKEVDYDPYDIVNFITHRDERINEICRDIWGSL